MARTPNAKPPVLNTETVNGSEATDDLIIAADEIEGGDTLDAGANDDAAAQSVEELQRRLADANARAEREAAARIEAEKRVDQAGNQVADSNLRAIDNAITSAVAEKKTILAEITAAKEAGDYGKEAEALDRLQTLNIKVNRLGEGKAELERRIEYAKEQEELSRDPLEGYIVGAKLNPQAAAWMRQHPEIILTNGDLDREKLGDLEAAHYLAVSKRNRLQPGTQAYFEFIENELTGNGQQDDEPDDEPITPAPKTNGSRPAPAARVSRNAVDPSRLAAENRTLPSGVERRADGSYRLSPQRQEAASIAGLSNAEYLKNLLELQKEGQLTH